MKRLGLGLAILLIGASALAGMRARYGGELRVVVPALPQAQDPAQLTSSSDLLSARLLFGTLWTQAPDGALSPSLAAAVPEPEASGRFFRIRLRPGLRFQDGTPVTAREVISSLSRLADPKLESPYSALVLPLVGVSSSTGKIGGLKAGGELEVQASLAFAYPDWPRALAHPAASIVLDKGQRPLRGTGPFVLRVDGPSTVRYEAFPDCPTGRPFADSLSMTLGDSRSAGRQLALSAAELTTVSLAEKGGTEGPALQASYLALNPAKLGAQAAPVRQAFEAALEVGDLTRFFVRGPASPMYGLLPPALDPASSAPRARPASPQLPAGMELTLLVESGDENHRAVAERMQVKLHDLGLALKISRLPRPAFRKAVAGGAYELALVSVMAIPEAGMALAQLVSLALGREAAREELRTIGGGADAAARKALALARAEQLLPRLPLLPLYAQASRVLARPGVAGIGFDASGAPSLADGWLSDPPRVRAAGEKP